MMYTYTIYYFSYESLDSFVSTQLDVCRISRHPKVTQLSANVQMYICTILDEAESGYNKKGISKTGLQIILAFFGSTDLDTIHNSM